MQLSYSDKRKINQPVQIAITHDKTSDIDYFLESSVEKDDSDNTTHYTLSFYATTFVKAKAKEKQIVEIHELNGKKSVLETGNYATEKLVKKLMLTATFAVDITNDIYVIKTEDWTEDSERNITDKKGSAIDVESLVYEEVYDDFKIRTHQDVFSALIELNAKAIYKNPTISLLLRFLEFGASSYTPVFLEWYEEQFVNPKNKYHAEFGSAFALEYNELKAKEELPDIVTLTDEEPVTSN